MIQGLIEILGALVACMGFALIYLNRPKRVFLCGLSGAVSWGVYLVAAYYLDNNIFVANLIAATVGTLLAEILARLTKAPATIYLILAVLPMVPGGSLYYTTYNLVRGYSDTAKHYGVLTAQAAIGIAVGLVIATVITYYFNLFSGKKQEGINGLQDKIAD